MIRTWVAGGTVAPCVGVLDKAMGSERYWHFLRKVHFHMRAVVLTVSLSSTDIDTK